jgi:ribonuclease J
MRACIHKGAKQVGGSCVELESGGKHLLVDLGLPFDADLEETPLPVVEGLTERAPGLLGILISHPHLDHYGLLAKISESVPVYIGAGAKRIVESSAPFFPNRVELKASNELEHLKPFPIGPFTITPFLMDHSAYDSYGFLIEADGKRIFYSGDFRGHGRKGKLLDALATSPPRDIDILLMEGSTIGRKNDATDYPSEEDLEKKLAYLFSRASGMNLVWTSSQNIDRMLTLYRACRKTRKTLVLDMYSAHILRSLQDEQIPQPGWDGIQVYLPKALGRIVRDNELFDFAKSFPGRIYREDFKKAARDLVFLFRPSMARDFEEADCLEGACLIYSLWPGYLKETRLQWFAAWLEKRNIPIRHCHTSGHAAIADLQRLAGALAPKRLVPIHSFEPDRYPDFFDNVVMKRDGEWWKV